MPSTTRENPRFVDLLFSQVIPKPPSSTIRFERYLLSGQTLLLQADVYRKSGDEANLFLCLLRFASLMVDTLPKYPKCPQNHIKYVEFRRKLDEEYLPELESLKLILATVPIPNSFTLGKTQPRASPSIGMSSTPQLDWSASGAPNQEALPPHPTDRLPSNATATASSIVPSRADFITPPPQFNTKISAKVASGKTIEKHSLFGMVTPPSSQSAHISRPSLLNPPSVSFPAIAVPKVSLIDQAPVVNPPMEIMLAPQEIEVQQASSVPMPGAETCSCPPPPQLPESVANAGVPSPAELLKHGGLRDVNISIDLMESFLRLAKSNTQREIETCAILAGKLRPDVGVLEVNTLLVPRQKGTRDQVEMVEEETLLEEVLMNGLMVLGWIHTHPVFQCFLSSIDVHTTLPYQLLLDEALAIVMAPTDRKRKCGVFRLTTPGGMDVIRKCEKRGFHQHEPTNTKQPIYETASRVFIDQKISVNVKDMR